MRQAMRLNESARDRRVPSVDELRTIEAEDILKSRVFEA
jgi:hypothetical protein